MTASFAIKNGVAHNEDLDVKAPLFRIGGKGDIDIGNRRSTTSTKATVVATTKGQGGKDLEQLAGLTVPVHLAGPFDAHEVRGGLRARSQRDAREVRRSARRVQGERWRRAGRARTERQGSSSEQEAATSSRACSALISRERRDPLRRLVQAGDRWNSLAARGQEAPRARDADLLQRLEAVGDEARADHVDALHALARQLHQRRPV